MGALVLEAAFLSLLRETDQPLVKELNPQDPSANERSIVEVKLDDRRVVFPTSCSLLTPLLIPASSERSWPSAKVET